jgi:hypothetical protein
MTNFIATVKIEIVAPDGKRTLIEREFKRHSGDNSLFYAHESQETMLVGVNTIHEMLEGYFGNPPDPVQIRPKGS